MVDEGWNRVLRSVALIVSSGADSKSKRDRTLVTNGVFSMDRKGRAVFAKVGRCSHMNGFTDPPLLSVFSSYSVFSMDGLFLWMCRVLSIVVLSFSDSWISLLLLFVFGSSEMSLRVLHLSLARASCNQIGFGMTDDLDHIIGEEKIDLAGKKKIDHIIVSAGKKKLI